MATRGITAIYTTTMENVMQRAERFLKGRNGAKGPALPAIIKHKSPHLQARFFGFFPAAH